ncbi:MAG: CarD family transcriptional regulator, partial [Candidatus Desantisbacteria bacterium]
LEKAFSYSGAGVSISGLSGSSKAYLLAGFFVHFGHLRQLNRSVLIINPRIHEAEQLYEDLQAFCQNSTKSTNSTKSKKNLSEAKEMVMDYFPSLEVLPYEENPPSDELVGQRFAILERLSKGERIVLVTSLAAILYRISSPKDMLTIKVLIEDTLSRDSLLEDLVMIGYERAGMTYDRGDFSCRGGIVDVFPISAEYPVRIEFFGDTIESIRQFDPDTQRSIGFLNKVEIFPRQEIAEKTSSIFDYLSDNCLIIIDEKIVIEQEFMRLRQETESLYQEACHGQQLPSPDQIMLKLEDILRHQQMLYLNAANCGDRDFFIPTFPSPSSDGKLEPLMQKLKEYMENGYTIVLSVNYQGQAQRLQELLKEHGLEAGMDIKSTIVSGIFIVVSSIICGFDLPELRLLLMSDKEIFGKSGILHRRRFSRLTKNVPIESFMELNTGDFVVHIHHGIGTYLGITTTTVEGKNRDFLLIEYAQGDRLYVPIDQLGLIHKYIGDKDSPP